MKNNKKTAAKKKNSWKKKSGVSPSKAILAVIAIGLVFVVLGYLLDGYIHRVNEKTAGAIEVVISEVQNSNEHTIVNEAGSAANWFEIQNRGSKSVSLKGMSFVLDAQVNKIFVLPDIKLAANECLLVFADDYAAANSTFLHAPFDLPAAGGSTLYFFDVGNQLIDSVEIPNMEDDESYCRASDGSWVVSAQATPGERNLITENRVIEINEVDGPLKITELMSSNNCFFPDENGNYCDYVEIYNATDSEINLGNYYLSDNQEELDKWAFPEMKLAPRSYLAVHCSGENNSGNAAHVHADFKLSSDGETVFLSDADLNVLSATSFPKLEVGQAYSYYGERWTTQLPATPNYENDAQGGASVASEIAASNSTGVLISEVMALPETEEHDWIELYNSTSGRVDISGYGISDELSRPRKWQFPQGSYIEPNGYLIVYLTGEESITVPGYNSLPFALAAAGEYTLSLSTPDGEVIDTFYMPLQYSGISYGRNTQGVTGYLKEATPLKKNSDESKIGSVKQAIYSVQGGLFDKGEKIQLTFECEPGAKVYYTLDCHDPDEGSSLYNGTPIEISSTTVVRTRVYKDGYLPSVIETQSYLFGIDSGKTVPYVISLVSDPDGLYSSRSGIMVKGKNPFPEFPYGAYGQGANFWMDWEREAHIEFFTPDGSRPISQNCGIKIHGRNSRGYSIKAFKVIARTSYGAPSFNYPIFSDRDYTEYPSFILRASGQDHKFTFMRDPVLTSLADNTSVLYMEAEECVVFLNGKYYSAMYLRERYTAEYICKVEGWVGYEDDIDLVKAGTEVMQGSNAHHEQLLEWLRTHDCSTMEAYNVIDEAIDIDNFIEYCALQTYIGTPDTVNVKRYRNPYGDGKWRWILYDVDRGLRENTNGFEVMHQGTNGRLFRSCMENPMIRERFLVHLNQQLATVFSSENVLNEVQMQYERIEEILPDYLDEVNVTRSEYRDSMEFLVRNVENRPRQVIKQCENYLRLSDAEVEYYFADALQVIKEFEKNNK